MKRHASIWTCGTLALCALLACAVSAAGLLYGTRWALLAPGALLGIAPGLAAAASGGRSRLRPAGLALGALLGLGIAVLGGPVRAGLWSNALQRPQAALVCGALLGSAWSAGEGGRVDARGGWLSGGLTLAVALAGLALSAGTRSAAAALGLQLLPLAVGLLLPARATGAGRWVCLALGLALLAPVGLALLGQMAGAQDGALAALNAAFFRRARMENVSACLLLGAGPFLRAALPGGEKRA